LARRTRARMSSTSVPISVSKITGLIIVKGACSVGSD
jgi:hypothetical protein